MILEVEYKKAYNLYRAGSKILIGTFKSRQEAVEFNHRLTIERIQILKKVEAHNSKFKGAHTFWSTK